VSGKQIKLFLVDGVPGGLTTAEITNWVGHVLAAPRSDLKKLSAREQAKRTGVYLLLGEDPQAVGSVKCYVGEADNIADRLQAHEKNKDWWDRVVVITSKDANLTKSHGRYLESKLIALAKQAGRVELDNATAPPLPPMPEADASDMDEFIDQLQVVLPVLGINAIRVREARPETLSAESDRVSPVFRLINPKLGVDARAQQVDGEFTMLAGSSVVGAVRTSTKYSPSTARAYASYRTMQEKLVADGSITVTDGRGTVARDIPFSSPSTAGAIALGRSCNGRQAWISSDGMTFGAWESRGVE